MSRANWPEWRRINTDFPADADYDTWMKNIKEFADRIALQGGVAIKVDVDPAAFAAWCKSRWRDIDGNARSYYAGLRLIELNRGGDK